VATAGHRNLKICVAQKRRDLNKRGILLISTPQTIDTVYHDGACSLVPMEKLPIDTTMGRNKQMIEIDGTTIPPARLSTGVERNRGGASEGGIVGPSKLSPLSRFQILPRSPLPPVIGNAQWPRPLPHHP